MWPAYHSPATLRRIPSRRERDNSAVDCQLEPIEPRLLLAVTPAVQFLIDSANLYSVSTNPADAGSPIVPIYTDNAAGGTYLANVFAGGMTLDGNDPDAGRGFSSWRATLNAGATSGFFQFVLSGAVRDVTDFGHANTLRFMAKGDKAGQQVQVTVANNVSNVQQVFTLGTTWQNYALTLPAGVKPSGVSGVTFQTGTALSLDPGNGTFRVDDVRLDTDGYDPLRIVQSYRQGNWAATGATDPVTIRDGLIYPNRSFLYDNALTIEALDASGDAGARTVAKQITDALIATARTDGSYYNQRNAGHVLDGSGNPRSPFSSMQTLGDNAWFGLALMDEYALIGDTSYLDRAKQISDWAETNLKATGPLKGYRGGFDSSGAAFPWRATEHNIDLFALNKQIADALTARGDAAASTYAARATYAGDFVVAMFDPTTGKFWTGTGAGDTLNQDSVPLDVQLWSGLSLGLSSQYSGALDFTRPRTWAETHLQVTDGSYTGFTFSDHSTANDVWFEGTGQAAVLETVQGQTAKYSSLLATIESTRTNHPNGNGQGVVAVSHDSLIDNNLGATYDARLSVAATGWLAFAEQKTNPFANPVGITASADARYTLTGAIGAQTLNITAGSVTFANDLSTYYQNLSITVGAGATATFAADEHLASLTVNGAAKLTATSRKTLTTSSFTIATGGTLDLGAGNIVLTTLNGQPATAASVQALVKQAAGATRPSGRHPWNGAGGITSSLAQADAANNNAAAYAIGIADASDNAVTHLGLTTGQVTARVAAYGDADLNNIVDIADLSAWNNAFAAGNHWAQGDFNYDGVVDIADLSMWNNNFGGTVAPNPAAPVETSTPPATAAASTVALPQPAAPTDSAAPPTAPPAPPTPVVPSAKHRHRSARQTARAASAAVRAVKAHANPSRAVSLSAASPNGSPAKRAAT